MAPTNHQYYSNQMTITLQWVSDMDAAQVAYFDIHGHFYQGIITPATPLDGTTLGDLDLNVKPTDQAEDWFDFDPVLFPQGKKLAYQIRSDVYKAPSGQGYVLTGDLYYAGLGPDAYGHYGDHIVYRHHVGLEVLDGIFDEWYIQVDSEI